MCTLTFKHATMRTECITECIITFNALLHDGGFIFQKIIYTTWIVFLEMSVHSSLSGDSSYTSDFSPILFENILGPDTGDNDSDTSS